MLQTKFSNAMGGIADVDVRGACSHDNAFSGLALSFGRPRILEIVYWRPKILEPGAARSFAGGLADRDLLLCLHTAMKVSVVV